MLSKVNQWVQRFAVPAAKALGATTMALAMAIGAYTMGESVSGVHSASEYNTVAQTTVEVDGVTQVAFAEVPASDFGYTPLAQVVHEAGAVVRSEFDSFVNGAFSFSAHAEDGQAVTPTDLGINYKSTVENVATEYGKIVLAFLALLLAIILYRVFVSGTSKAASGRA